MKIRNLIIVFASIMVIMTSCDSLKKIKEPDPSSTASDSAELLNYNNLTGLYDLEDSGVGKRPVTVMISNIKQSLPQRGICSSDVCYEVLAEGGITRIMAVFSDYTKVPTTGPVRSVREYFIDFAKPLDPIFVHFGGSTTGNQRISSEDIDTIDGFTASGSKSFWSDKSIAQQKGKEHSYFTDSLYLKPLIEKYKFDMNAKSSKPLFNFLPPNEKNVPNEISATKVTVPFSSYAVSTFEYDSDTAKYKKSQFKQPHIDANTGGQVAVDNVIIIFTPTGRVDYDNVHIQMELKGGKGYYISQGKAAQISWSKADADSNIKYVLNGQELRVNAGTSWICIVPTSSYNSVAFEA